MFTSARIKLTAWYLLIIMAVSIAFSFFIYEVLSMEINRFARMQRFRIERRTFDIQIIPPTVDSDLINETKRRLVLNLLVINGTILTISAVLGYFLAGRTLAPIEVMVEEQNRFISDSSHELRTPLTALKSSLEVNLRDKNLKLKDARKLIAESIDDVNKLQSLSDKLLRLAQYENPGKHLSFEVVSLDQVISDSVNTVMPLAAAKNIKIKNQVKGVEVFGNKYSLTELFVILLDNAIKYSPTEKSITITSKKNIKNIKVSIKDEGVGISRSDLNRIFERFYRSDASRTITQASGFGLGLSIAKKIVDNHRATINVESTPNKGSTFQITFSLRA